MIYTPKRFNVSSAEKLAGDTVLLRVDANMPHEPGQFAQLSLLGIGEVPVSFCSYSKGYVEFAVRDVGSVTHLLCNLKKGDSIWLRGPFGNGFPLRKFFGRSIVVVGGGTGVAPLRSVVEYVGQSTNFLGLQLFFGFKGYEEVLFKDDFSRWRRTCRISISLDNPCKHYKCFTGFVTDLVKQSDIGKDSAAFICGPPVMTKFAVQNLLEKGLDEKNVFVSLERLMQCGVGKCGHCMINDKYVCKDGPVFKWSVAKNLRD